MHLDGHLLRRAKRENLLRLARAMGLRLPPNTHTETICKRILKRNEELRARDDWERMRRNNV